MYSHFPVHHVFCGTTHPGIDIPHAVGNTSQLCLKTDSASNTKDAKHAAHCGIWSTGARSFCVNLYNFSLRKTIVATELSPERCALSASMMNLSIRLSGVVMKVGAVPLSS